MQKGICECVGVGHADLCVGAQRTGISQGVANRAFEGQAGLVRCAEADVSLLSGAEIESRVEKIEGLESPEGDRNRKCVPGGRLDGHSNDFFRAVRVGKSRLTFGHPALAVHADGRTGRQAQDKRKRRQRECDLAEAGREIHVRLPIFEGWRNSNKRRSLSGLPRASQALSRPHRCEEVRWCRLPLRRGDAYKIGKSLL